MGTKPPAAIDGRIPMDGRHHSNTAAPLSTTLSSLQGRAGGPAFTPNLVELVVGPCRKATPTHSLYLCCGTLRALASLLSVCGPVCLRPGGGHQGDGSLSGHGRVRRQHRTGGGVRAVGLARSVSPAFGLSANVRSHPCVAKPKQKAAGAVVVEACFRRLYAYPV